MQEKAKDLVVKYFNERHQSKITVDDVFIVWFCKTLQNWKAMVSTKIPDGMYYEVTYNGNFKETYIDAYKKWENVCVKDED